MIFKGDRLSGGHRRGAGDLGAERERRESGTNTSLVKSGNRTNPPTNRKELYMITKARAELSPQQLTIMQLSWDGLTIKETAAWMGLSDKTVKNYRNNIYEKLGVSNVEGMLRQGVERGFLSVSSRVQEWP